MGTADSANIYHILPSDLERKNKMITEGRTETIFGIERIKYKIQYSHVCELNIVNAAID